VIKPRKSKLIFKKLAKSSLEELSETVFKNFQIAFENSVILF